MKTASLKYSPGGITERNKLGMHCSGNDFNKKILQSTGYLLHKKFEEIDLMNGYRLLVKDKNN